MSIQSKILYLILALIVVSCAPRGEGPGKLESGSGSGVGSKPVTEALSVSADKESKLYPGPIQVTLSATPLGAEFIIL